MTAGGWKHSRITVRATFLLESWAQNTKRGRVLAGEAGLITERDPDTVRGADVVYISYQRLPEGKEPESFVETPPELVVEVIGKGQGWSKMLAKAGEYMQMGVDRVWILNPKAKTVHVVRPDEDPLKLVETDTIQDDSIMPGFSCKVAEFFAA